MLWDEESTSGSSMYGRCRRRTPPGSRICGFSTMFGVASVIYLSLSCWDVSSRGRAGCTVDFGLVAVLCLLLLAGLAHLEIAVVARSGL